jgi:hypothetical protein
MERELTVRQRRFAAGIASGLTKSAAYRAAYTGTNMKKGTLDTVAKKAAKNPRVKAEIGRLTLEMLPRVEDMRAAYHHAFSTILKLTIDSQDDRLRFDAARWVRAEYEKRERLAPDIVTESHAESAPESAERVIEALRGLYAKAFGTQQAGEPLMLEVEVEGTVPEGDCAPVESPDGHTDASGAEEPASSKGDSTETDRCPDGEQSEPMFSWVPVPGRFPPKFRRMRIR